MIKGFFVNIIKDNFVEFWQVPPYNLFAVAIHLMHQTLKC